MARLSVIVPVYNVEAYLDECLDSLAAQTFGDIEIVCVNDGSTDSSRSILAEHARRDGRIKVVDKPNGGLSSARNAGMEAATSEYLCFLDSDDRYLPNACQRIVEELDASFAELLCFGGLALPRSASYPWLEEVFSPRDVLYEAFEPALLLSEATKPLAVRLSLRRDFALRENIHFDESVRYGEDQVFAFAVFPRSRRTLLISDKLYEYRIARGDSLVNRMLANPARMLREHVAMERRILDDWKRMGILERYSDLQLAWIVELVLFDAMRLSDVDCAAIFSLASETLLVEWDLGRIEKADVGLGTRLALLCAKRGRPPRGLWRKALMSLCYVDKRGVLGLLRRLFMGPRKAHG